MNVYIFYDKAAYYVHSCSARYLENKAILKSTTTFNCNWLGNYEDLRDFLGLKKLRLLSW